MRVPKHYYTWEADLYCTACASYLSHDDADDYGDWEDGDDEIICDGCGATITFEYQVETTRHVSYRIKDVIPVEQSTDEDSLWGA